MASNESNKLNFSINFILNHAGDRYKKCKIANKYEMITSSSSGEDESCDSSEKKCYENLYVDNRKFIEIPTFNWLNYTRYNMPRLPRPSKGPLKRTSRLPRIPFTSYQLSELEKAYKNASYLSTEDANLLARKLELTGVRVKIWFQNRRARDRREHKDPNGFSTTSFKQLHDSNTDDEDNDDNDDEVVVS